jgi:epoxyqueuosine reductase
MPVLEDVSFFYSLSDSRRILPSVKAIILLCVYAYDSAAVYKNTRRDLRGKTARTYNYYPVVRIIAEHIAEYLEDRGHAAVQGQHVPLKYVSQRMGIGAYGKNGIIQTEQYGTYVTFRDILTDAELKPDAPVERQSMCEKCELCLKACPTGALYAPYKVNPKLCINPLTRKDGYIEPALRTKMLNWVHGCDICQEVCPANTKLSPRGVDPRSGFDSRHHSSHKYLDGMERTPDLVSIISEKWPQTIRRNAVIALTNTGKGKREVITELKSHIKTASPEVKEYFEWALETLGG